MKFVVIPLHGINDVLFGMSRARVRELLGAPDRSSKRRESDPSPFDLYFSYELFCYYDAADKLDAVEFGSLGDVSIFDEETTYMNCDQMRRLFESRGYQTEDDPTSSGFKVPAIAIVVTGGVSDATPDRDVESFYAGRAL